MNLLKELERYRALTEDGGRSWYYKPNNYKKGLCNTCGNRLYKKGKSWVTCEYHYLKKKYSSAKSKIALANGNSMPTALQYLNGIKCSITWEEFLEWCIENKDYKKMKNPTLIRKNKKRNFTIKNILWVDGSNFL